MNGITIQVSKQDDVCANTIRHILLERWNNLDSRNGGSLCGKAFIPFRKECTLINTRMNNIIEQQTMLLASTK
jgi:hypothetical protein